MAWHRGPGIATVSLVSFVDDRIMPTIPAWWAGLDARILPKSRPRALENSRPRRQLRLMLWLTNRQLSPSSQIAGKTDVTRTWLKLQP